MVCFSETLSAGTRQFFSISVGAENNSSDMLAPTHTPTPDQAQKLPKLMETEQSVYC